MRSCAADVRFLKENTEEACQRHTGPAPSGEGSKRRKRKKEPAASTSHASVSLGQDGVVQPRSETCAVGDGRKKKKRKVAPSVSPACHPTCNAGVTTAEEMVDGQKQKSCKKKSKSESAAHSKLAVNESKNAQPDSVTEPNNSTVLKYAPSVDGLCASVRQFRSLSYCPLRDG